MMEFRDKLRRALAKNGWTQKELAAVLKVGATTIESWLADPDKSWSRTPSAIAQTGVLYRIQQASKEIRLRSGNYTPTPPEQRRRFDRERAQQMRDGGMTDTQIAAELGVKPQAIYDGLRRHAAAKKRAAAAASATPD